MRIDSPPVTITAGPPGGVEPFVIRSPPNRIDEEAVLFRRLEVHAEDLALLRNVHALLGQVIVGVPGKSTTAWRIRERKEVQERRPVRTKPVARNNIQAQRVVRRGARGVAETGALVGGVAIAGRDARIADESLVQRSGG